MTDKIIKLKDGLEYYVIDEFIENKRIFLFGIQVDSSSEVLTDNCVVCEIKFDGSGLVLSNIENIAEQESINNKFIERLKESSKED